VSSPPLTPLGAVVVAAVATLVLLLLFHLVGVRAG